MNNIKHFLLVFAVILIIFPVITLAEEVYKLESSFQFGTNEIVIDGEKGEVDIHSICDFGNFGVCNDICGNKGECISPEKCVCG